MERIAAAKHEETHLLHVRYLSTKKGRSPLQI